MVFQDPYSSINPAKRLGYVLSRPLVNYQGLKGDELRERVEELLETVALTPADRFVNRYGYELSGGQRQRVVIAKALAVEPEIIVADEPISSLDVSIRAEILELLNDLVQDNDVGILYITHDLLSARMLSDEVIVLNDGKVVEQGPTLKVIRDPKDDYTRNAPRRDPQPVLRRRRSCEGRRARAQWTRKREPGCPRSTTTRDRSRSTPWPSAPACPSPRSRACSAARPRRRR